MAAVDVESLTITYRRVTAVDDLSFQAEAGQVTCVLGPNGAGKTSTIEALEGLRRPTSGRLSVIGLNPRTEHRALTERIGVMLQEGGIHPAVRVREALRHASALYRDPVDARALVERLGLAGLDRRTCRQLSGGERQRLALALALVGRPQVAFLDEPTSGVDPAGRQVIRQVVADLRNDGVTVILTTHDIDEAERIADRVVIVVDGRLVAAGTVDELTRSSASDEQVRFRAPAGLDRGSLAERLDGPSIVEAAPGEYVVATAPTPRTVAAITAWLADHDLPLADLRAGRQRLEDVYLSLTAEGMTAEGMTATSGRPDRPGPADDAPATPPNEAADTSPVAPPVASPGGGDDPGPTSRSSIPPDGDDDPEPASRSSVPPDGDDDPVRPERSTAATFEDFWRGARSGRATDDADGTGWADWTDDQAAERPEPEPRPDEQR